MRRKKYNVELKHGLNKTTKKLNKKVKGAIALTLCLSMLLAGCGKKLPSAPELLEPVSGNESYRVVDRGDVGALSLYYGTVVPEETAHFWTTGVEVKELSVDIGDYVTAGQVLAVADINFAKEQVESLQASLSEENSVFQLSEQKYTLKKDELNLKLQGETTVGDSEGAAATKLELDTLEENHRYDVLMHNHRLSNLNKDIDENKKIVTDGTLVARESGYVNFVRDISNNARVTSGDNVVVIADYDHCYVRMNDVGIDQNILKNVSDCYTFQNGQRYNLEDYRYSPETYLVAQSIEQYPAQRLKYEKENAIGEVGSVVPIFISNHPSKDVLRVGNDSIYNDDQGSFVYVKNGDSREIRYIEVGKSDSSYTEVLSGLSENEKVFYVSKSAMPTKYEEYPVAMGDYDGKSLTDFYSVEESVKKGFYSEYEGQVVTIAKQEGALVVEGELIATIKTNEGSARLAEMRVALENMKKGNEDTKKGIDDQIKELEKKRDNKSSEGTAPTATDTDAISIEGAENETDDAATDTDASYVNPNEQQIIEKQIEQLNLDKQIADIQFNNQYKKASADYKKASCNNDGTGVVNIYAKSEGKISGMQLKEGKKLEVSDKMFNIDVPRKKKLVIQLRKQMALGTVVSFYNEQNNKSYVGTIVGERGKLDEGGIYATTLNNKTYMTTNDAAGNRGYYVEFSDDSFYDETSRMMGEYSTITISGVVVIPAGLLYTEAGVEMGEEDRYYVWKIVDGDLEKQYVTAELYVSSQDTINGNMNTGEGVAVACILRGLSDGDVLAKEVLDVEVSE